MIDRAAHVKSSTPIDPIEGVRTTAQLRTARHADDRKPMLNHYIRQARVGNGQHGEVYLCYDINDNKREVAIKAVKRHNPRAEKWSMMRRRNLPMSPHTAIADKLGTTEYKIRKEIAIMKKCRHGHVVRLLEVIDDKLKEKIYMVMEYLGGGEVKWVNTYNQPIQTVDQTRRIIRDVILGLEYLHYQGIIHRDIKPANLLWTADRSMVKISDFGVSHFSYAQRLAAAGRNKEDLDDPHDPILMDDSDLCKTAGTPSFLAPEVVFDSGVEPSPVNTVSVSEIQTQGSTTPAARRPPITKATDIWALGVTLYCLLFGQVPFVSKDGHEWSLYKVICTQDWSVPPRMGFDQLETGGRHVTEKNTESFPVISLLESLLQKDASKRATLDQVKRHPWFTRDLPNPEQWLRETSPKKNDIVEVSEQETNTAMSTVQFRWNWGKRITSHLSSLLRTVRPRASLRPPAHSPRRAVTPKPAGGQPTIRAPVARAKSTSAYSMAGRAASAGPRRGSLSRRDKGKERADPYARRPSLPGILTGRSKSIDRYTYADHQMMARVEAKGRRGSETLLSPVGPVPFSRSSTPQVKRVAIQCDDRLRTRFSLSAILRWRPNKYSSHGSSLVDESSAGNDGVYTQPLNDVQSAVLIDQFSRRSEEALRHHRTTQCVATEPLTAARRASSWGETPSDYFMEEVASLNSEEPPELDHDVMIRGAGGVCNDFVLEPVVISSSGSGSVSASPESPGALGIWPSTSERYSPVFISTPFTDATTATRTSSFMHHPHSTSPLTQVAYDSQSSPCSGNHDDAYSSSAEDFDDNCEGESDDDGGYEDDEDEDDDDAAPIEVRRRVPVSPPPLSDRSDSPC